jgi:hypothetical protein
MRFPCRNICGNNVIGHDRKDRSHVTKIYKERLRDLKLKLKVKLQQRVLPLNGPGQTGHSTSDEERPETK